MKLIEFIVGLVIAYFLVCLPYGRIFSRAGHSKWLSLLILVPLANIILIWWFAFTDWDTSSANAPRA